jgi:hypothetical protein
MLSCTTYNAFKRIYGFGVAFPLNTNSASYGWMEYPHVCNGGGVSITARTNRLTHLSGMQNGIKKTQYHKDSRQDLALNLLALNAYRTSCPCNFN